MKITNDYKAIIKSNIIPNLSYFISIYDKNKLKYITKSIKFSSLNNTKIKKDLWIIFISLKLDSIKYINNNIQNNYKLKIIDNYGIVHLIKIFDNKQIINIDYPFLQDDYIGTKPLHNNIIDLILKCEIKNNKDYSINSSWYKNILQNNKILKNENDILKKRNVELLKIIDKINNKIRFINDDEKINSKNENYIKKIKIQKLIDEAKEMGVILFSVLDNTTNDNLDLKYYKYLYDECYYNINILIEKFFKEKNNL